MLAELQEINPGGIEILGSGLGRDLGWIQPAIGPEFKIKIRDKSKVACLNATWTLNHRHLTQWVEVTQMEVMAGWKSGEINERRVVAYYACQFIEHQRDAVKEFMYHFGRFLRKPGRRLYLVLPRLEDNPPKKVKWNSAVPPSDAEWQTPLKKGCGRKLKFYVLGRHKYFNHRKYTFFRISR